MGRLTGISAHLDNSLTCLYRPVLQRYKYEVEKEQKKKVAKAVV